MKRVRIKFSSVTHALNAKNIIEKNGGRVTIGKNTSPRKNEGCGYYIIVFGNTENYISLLEQNKVSIVGIDYI